MVPGVGIEPTTLSSSGLRSTTELPRHICKENYTDNSTRSALFVNINRYFSHIMPGIYNIANPASLCYAVEN